MSGESRELSSRSGSHTTTYTHCRVKPTTRTFRFLPRWQTLKCLHGCACSLPWALSCLCFRVHTDCPTVYVLCKKHWLPSYTNTFPCFSVCVPDRADTVGLSGIKTELLQLKKPLLFHQTACLFASLSHHFSFL